MSDQNTPPDNHQDQPQAQPQAQPKSGKPNATEFPTPKTQTQVHQQRAVQTLTKAVERTLQHCPVLESVVLMLNWKPSPYLDPSHQLGTICWMDDEGVVDPRNLLKTLAVTRAITSTVGLLEMQFEALATQFTITNETVDLNRRKLDQLLAQIDKSEKYYEQLQKQIKRATEQLNRADDGEPEAAGDSIDAT